MVREMTSGNLMIYHLMGMVLTWCSDRLQMHLIHPLTGMVLIVYAWY
jgi:hypothetical protein